MASTLGVSTHSQSSDGQPPRWLLVVAAGAAVEHPGANVGLGPGEQLVVGRESDALHGAFADKRISREHAVFEVRGAGLWVRDLGSHNGTSVAGRRITEVELEPGDVVTCGAAVLVVARLASGTEPASIDGLVGIGPVHAALALAVRAVAKQSTPVLLTGETGTGKDHLARLIHDHSGRGGELVTLDCGAAGDGEALFGDGALASEARDGTLYLDGITDSSAALQTRLMRLLEADAQSHRIVASCEETLEQTQSRGLLKPGLAARLSQWVVHLPPLRDRREDLPLLAAAFAERFTGTPTPLHHRTMRALLRARWPGNLHELRGAVERAIVEAGGRRPVPRPDFLVVDAESSSAGERDKETRLEVGPGCKWFRCGGESNDLSKRAALSGVLDYLVNLHATQPNTVAAPIELVRAGWPGEAMSDKAGVNRVYVAISTLRKLGLRDAILRSSSGYRIDPRVVIRRRSR